MRIKRSFLLNGNEWTVVFKRNIGCDGICDYNTKTITLEQKLPPADKLEALKHELNHAIMDELLLVGSEGLSPTHQETLAEGFRLHYNKLFDLKWRSK